MDFKEVCLQNGFRHVRGTYCRCIGDGVLQTIFEHYKTYIEPSSPEYSDKQRTAKYITFGLWSLYAKLPEECFNWKQTGGLFAPANLLGKRWHPGPFMGNLTDRRNMVEYGIPFLNDITTQEKLADAVISLSMTEYHQLLPFQTDLYAPLLKCGRNYDAITRVEAKLANLWIRFFEKVDQYKESGFPLNFWEQHEYAVEETKELSKLWSMIAGMQECNIERFLCNNYNTNMERVIRYKIPICNSVACNTGESTKPLRDGRSF